VLATVDGASTTFLVDKDLPGVTIARQHSGEFAAG